MEHEARVRPDPSASFADLIAPTSLKEFFDDYWEKKYLHVRDSHGRFANYFCLRDVEQWIPSTRSGTVFVLLPDGDDSVRLEIHKAKDLTANAVFDNTRRGLAQIFKRLADWPSLQGLVKHLGWVFHANVHVNAFLTPPGARTHPTYTCNDDILVLQLEGEEDWRLHEGKLLQLALSQKQHLEFPDAWHHRTETPVLAKVRLQPGDLLFIPRGMPHFTAAPETTSLHLRIYITPLFWMDFLKIAAEHAALQAPELRSALPPGFVDDDVICERMAGAFQQVMEVFRDVPFERVLAAVKRNRVTLQGFPPGSQADSLTGTEGLTPGVEVERIPDVLCMVDVAVDAEGRRKSSIAFGDHQISGPPGLVHAMKFIRDHTRFRVSEIPGLDEKGQLVLARRLLTEGLLRRVCMGKESQHPEEAPP